MQAACDAVQERLEEALLSRSDDAPAADLAHARACAACGRVRDELAALRVGLDALAAPELPAAAFAAAKLRAADALARGGRAVPAGFGRELVRVLAPALAALPIVLAWNAAVVVFGGELLSGLVPTALLSAAGAAYVAAASGWLAVVFGSLPLVAHQKARRLEEVAS